MVSNRSFIILMLLWFFGWSFLLLWLPTRALRVLAWGRRPTSKELKRARVVGYMGLFFGCLLLVEIALGMISVK